MAEVFPLPLGHKFGRNPYSAMHHDGRTFYEGSRLMCWQKDYRDRWDSAMVPSGVYDGPTQRAAFRIQAEWGLPQTGEVDSSTWDALYDGLRATQSHEEALPIDSPAPPPKGGAAALSGLAEGPLAPSSRKARSRANKILWEHGRGYPPEWWSAAIGPGSPRADVWKVRSLLGLEISDNYAESVTQRIKGIQAGQGLLQTGVVDEATAWLLDKMAVTV